MNPPKTATLLVELLAEQEQARSRPLFKQGTFTLIWRAKVGSFPFPDLETIVSAGEPCGRFDWGSQFNSDQNPPAKKDKKPSPPYFANFSELAKSHKYRRLKLNGYIPGSAIRGIVRAWAMKRPDQCDDAIRLLGNQDCDSQNITPGKIEFLDAWPQHPTPLALDVVNPQERFQVYHDSKKQSEPHALYTLGDGKTPVTFTVAIRGIPGKVDAEGKDVDRVWEWLQAALAANGLGGRTASGYGLLKSSQNTNATIDPDHSIQTFNFTLYSQGSEGPFKQQKELRPAHWRGWLRSWTLRFLLGVMAKTQAKITLEWLFGTLESTEDDLHGRPKQHRQGCVRVQLLPGQSGDPWGELSQTSPDFYIWTGRVRISAPEAILKILLPIVKIAASVGGVGRGWRRPLHCLESKQLSRGTHLILTREEDSDPYQMPLDPVQWQSFYQAWAKAVYQEWGDRGKPTNLSAEVFSPNTCAIYVVPGPTEEPIDFNSKPEKKSTDFDRTRSRNQSSSLALERPKNSSQQKKSKPVETKPLQSQTIQWAKSVGRTRGDGVALIYQTKYKGNPNVGGNAAGGESSSCSWVSIRRLDVENPSAGTKCQEVVCLFLGQQTAPGKYDRDRTQFLNDLHGIDHSTPLFGLRGQSSD